MTVLDKLGRANYFTTVDLAMGYYQIKMHPRDIRKTAFVTINGLHEITRLPFGLKNAPATMQRIMNEILRDYIKKIGIVYLDDISIFFTSLEEHIWQIHVLNVFAEHNLKVQFFQMFPPQKSHLILGSCSDKRWNETKP